MQIKDNGEAVYTNGEADLVAFPLGGIGAGMICLEGSGALSHVSLRHRPDLNNEPLMFAALYTKDTPVPARVLEGPVPDWKISGKRFEGVVRSSSCGLMLTSFGLPRMPGNVFTARFPFATIDFGNSGPVRARVCGWSPFIPGNEDDSSLPVAALEYTFQNTSDSPVEAVFSHHSDNFLRIDKGGDSVERTRHGYRLVQSAVDGEAPETEAAVSVECDHPETRVDAAWFRGGWFDPVTMAFKNVEAGNVVDREPHAEGDPSPGASLYVPFRLAPGQSITITLRVSWYVPKSGIRYGNRVDEETPTYAPWYAGKFANADAVATYWKDNYGRLREEAETFSDCLYGSNIDPAIIEAIAANLSIFKSPTFKREHDGTFWGYEGCQVSYGSCHGTCTHVYNYVPAISQLFPALERSARETEFFYSQQEDGFQVFRSLLPRGQSRRDWLPAADGQLGAIVRVYREWRISGDEAWLRRIFPRVRQSMDFCIGHWDPDRTGRLAEPHHNTYDIEFWGPDALTATFYIAALAAVAEMCDAMGEPGGDYTDLAEKARKVLETELWNGEYLQQNIQLEGLNAPVPTTEHAEGTTKYSTEALELMAKEGPKYQYGGGCLSDGVLGLLVAELAGVDHGADNEKVTSHLDAVYRHNYRTRLTDHTNPQRPGYAIKDEGGLLLCTWPKGGTPSLPFVYSNEVWTGIEYQVATHLLSRARVSEALNLVKTARARYDGTRRNPFAETECGHWYVRALASWGLLWGLSGARYDAVEKKLCFRSGRPMTVPFFHGGAWGLLRIDGDQTTIDWIHGSLDVQEYVQE